MARRLTGLLAALAVSAACHGNAAREARAFVARGDRRATAGDLAGADIEYRNAVRRAPSSIEAHARLLDLASRRHDADGAAREVVALAELAPEDSGIQMQAGELYSQTGRITEAEQAFKRAVAIDESKAAPHRALALLYMRRQRSVDAEREWQAVAASRDGDPFALADFHASQGRLQAAEAELRALVGAVAQSDAGRLRLARVLYRQGRRADADRILDAIARRDPRNAVPWLVRGELRLSDHQTDAAAEAYAAALRIDPVSVDALTALTAIDLDAKRASDAAARVERALATSPDAVPLLILAGHVYESTAEYAKAEQHLARAIQLEPASFDAYALLGGVYIRQRRLADARQQFVQLADQHPTNPAAATMVGMLFEAEGRTSDARSQYERLLAASPHAGVAANNLACLYRDEGRLDDALRYAIVARRELPRLPQASDTLGWIYVQRKQPADALPLLSEAVERQPDNPQYRFHLAVAYVAIGAVAQARAELDVALKTPREFPGRDEAIRAKADLDRAVRVPTAAGDPTAVADPPGSIRPTRR